MIVIDTNVLIVATINESFVEINSNKLFNHELIAPMLCKTEFAHVLLKYLKGNHINIQQAHKAIELMTMALNFDTQSNPKSIFTLAEKFSITAYDAEFVALAIERETNLLTYDKVLLNTFPDICKKPAH